MTAPQVVVTFEGSASPSGVSVETGQLLVPGITERGPVGRPVLVTGPSSFQKRFGYAAWDTLTEPLRAYFGEGGGAAWVSRVVGPGADEADATIPVAGNGTDAVEVEAANPGEWGDDLTVEIEANGSTVTALVKLDDELVQSVRGIEDAAGMEAAFEGSEWIKVTAVGDGDEALEPGTYTLSGGDDDRGNITDTQWEDAIDALSVDLGPGQIAAPGKTSADIHEELLEHAVNRNRIAILDADEGDDEVSDLTTAVEAVKAFGFDASYATMASTPLRYRGVNGRPVKVPGSMAIAGRIAATDARWPTAHYAAAGEQGGLSRALSAVNVFTSLEDRGTLNDAGVIVIRDDRIVGVRVYGFRTLSEDQDWEFLTTARYRMGLASRLNILGERYLFRPLTPGTVSDYGNAIRAELLGDYEAGALLGDEPADAFSVNVSDDVNPVEDLAAGMLQAEVAVKPAPHGERVVIRVVKVRPTGTV